MARAASLVTADRIVPVVWSSGQVRTPWVLLNEGERLKGIYLPSNMRGVTEIRFRVAHDYTSADPTGYILRFAEEADNTPEPFEIGGSGYAGSLYPLIHYAFATVRRFNVYRQSGTNPTAELTLYCVAGRLWSN